MSKRLDQEREEILQPKRISYIIEELRKIGISPDRIDSKSIKFEFKGETITMFPYSGWHTGKSIVDGRGWKKLKSQLLKK